MPKLDKNKPSRKERLRLIASGCGKYFPTGQPIALAGQTFATPSELVTLIQKDIDATDASDRARADWLTAVHAQNGLHDTVAPVLRALKAQVLARYGDTGNAASTLADFGYAPRKVPSSSSADKAIAAAKGRATRAARHTMGHVQAKDVKGEVTTAVVTTPVKTVPVTPAVADAPAAVPVAAAPAAAAPLHTA